MTCGFGCGSCVFSRPRPAGDEWDLWSLPLDLSLLPYEIPPVSCFLWRFLMTFLLGRSTSLGVVCSLSPAVFFLCLLPYDILPAVFTISFLSLPLPSCCWIGVPEVLPFSLPDFGQLVENLLQDVDLFTMGLCWRAFWKVASLGVLISLSPAVFFLWLYYTTALRFRLFADRTTFICNICA